MAKSVKSIILFLITICVLGGGGYFLISQTNLISKTCTVVYNPNGGEVEETQVEVEKGKSLDLPTPTKDGYKFLGWFAGEEQWLNDDIVTGNLTLFARWEADKFTVTFNVDGANFQQKCDYGQIPVFSGSTNKSPTETKQYVFTGWLPEIASVTKSATYTAVYEEEERKFSVQATSNIAGVGEILGCGDFVHNTNTSITASDVLGYEFLGWYSNGLCVSADFCFDITNITKDWNLVAKYQIIIKPITYFNTFGAENENPTNYTVLDNVIKLTDLSFLGYNFGWYTQNGGKGNRVTEIDTSQLVEIVLYGYRTPIDYSITYELNGGNLPDGAINPTSYNIESADIQIVNPQKLDFYFVGWSGSNILEMTDLLIIQAGTTGNLHFVAVFTSEKKTISFVVDGYTLENSKITQELNSSLTAKPEINSSDYGFSAYKIDGWYTTASCEQKYTFPLTLNKNYVFYGRWDYVLNQGFYDYLDVFNSMKKSVAVDFDSFEMLVCYVEYVQFYDITEEGYYFNLNYEISAINGVSEVGNAIYKSTFPNGTFAYGCASSAGNKTNKCYVRINKSTRASDATKVADVNKEYVYSQVDYAYKISSSGRPLGYDEFKRNYVIKEISVETSNQLMYALEKGLKPVCVAGSYAENIYTKAKQVLREICDDGMDDVEKLRAIYEWMIFNVCYDNYAVETAEIMENWREYDSWYAEGVFNNGVAVCDGISKSVVILAQIENIACVRVSGTYNGGGHAWNKVCVDDLWYVMDVTHGNRAIVFDQTDLSKSKEAATYTNFLMSDAENEARGSIAEIWTDLQCDSTFDYYDSVSYTVGSEQFDLKVDNRAEFINILSYAKNLGISGEYTVEVKWNALQNINEILSSCAIMAGVTCSGRVEFQNVSTNSTVYLLFLSNR